MRRDAVLALVVLSGCGRVAFDPATARDAGDGDAPDSVVPGDVLGVDADFSMGLVAHYRFENAGEDSVAGNVAVCAGPPTCPMPTTGRIGSSAMLFDGVDDCISVVDTGQLQLPQLTLAVWARQDTAGTQSQVSKRVGGGSVNTWQLETDPLGTAPLALSFTTYDNSGLNQYAKSPNDTIQVGTWQHLAATFDGATKRVYVDGALVGTMPQTVPLPYDTNSMEIGCDDNQPLAEFFDGALDDLRVYNRPLAASEIAALAAQ